MKALKLKSKILLVLCLILTTVLCSCGGNMTDESVKAELERLLPLSYEMNDIFWGKGLPYDEPITKVRYVPVKSECGFKSTDEILAKAAEIYSAEYVEDIKSAVFTDTDDIDPRYMDVDGVLKTDVSNKGFDIKGNIDISTAKIKKQNRNTVIVSAKYEDGGDIEIALVLQDGKWYLDSATY